MQADDVVMADAPDSTLQSREEPEDETTRLALETMSIIWGVTKQGSVPFDRWLHDVERNSLPPGVEEDEGCDRVIHNVDFNGTLEQLQTQIWEEMHSINIDHNMEAGSYIISHRKCEPSSTYGYSHTGCNCGSRTKNPRDLITGQSPATTTLTELGMVPGHSVTVTTESPDPSNV